MNRPFLSVLIPVFNRDVSPLLRMLDAQCARQGDDHDVEIIAVEDGSTRTFANEETALSLERVRYERLPENTGRAAVRNHLFHLSRGDWVLFLDDDMLPDHEDFLARYLERAAAGCDVVCGGISYQQLDQDVAKHSFHVYRSLRTEALPAATRSREPWRYLFTSNIMVRREVMESVEFDPRFTAYGFEDVEWGVRLQERCRVEHIDNTCTHMGVMDKETVFARMREATANHCLLHRLYPEKTARAGAIAPARLLRHCPVFLLRIADRLLGRLFHFLSWNPLLYLIFQADKVVLLAEQLREEEPKRC
ncbi:MAG: polysaccharide biosynthesis protein HfsG [Desulfobulbaceae bacterium]